MAILGKVISSLASLSGIVSILLALFSLALSFIDHAASLFAFLGIPFAFFSLFSQQGTVWIKLFGIVFAISFSIYSFRSMYEENQQRTDVRNEEEIGVKFDFEGE